VRAARIHGNRSQSQRTQALEGFKAGRYDVLVATDIAARGIDVVALGHVVNYDVPAASEDYIHRVGRTGRAEATGEAFTFVAPEDEAALRAIERAVGKPLPRGPAPRLRLPAEAARSAARGPAPRAEASFPPPPASNDGSPPRRPTARAERPGRGVGRAPPGGGGARPAAGPHLPAAPEPIGPAPATAAPRGRVPVAHGRMLSSGHDAGSPPHGESSPGGRPFSWSASRHDTFATCRRRYYYSYYASLEDDEVRRLKKLSALPMWAGSVVHDTIESFLRTNDALPSPEEQEAFIRSVVHSGMLTDWQESEAGERSFRLFEHEYEVPVEPEDKRLAVNTVMRSLKHFFRSRPSAAPSTSAAGAGSPGGPRLLPRG